MASEENTRFPASIGGEKDLSQYTIHSRPEMAQILRAISRQTELVTAYFNHGRDFFLTSIVDVDPARDEIILDFGADAEVNRRAAENGKILFVTNQDRVKVQFSAPFLKITEFHGRPAFRTPFPDNLLKLQRRESYRLIAPIRAPLTCVIPDTGHGRFDAGVADISVGGIGLTGFSPEAILEIGQQFSSCRVALPEEGTVVSSLEIRNVQTLALRNGTQVKRAGCHFLDIPAPHQAMIQRYIIHIDRERRALVKGS